MKVSDPICRSNLACLLLLLFSNMIAGTASACSMLASYRAPTTLDLVANADTIIIARMEPVVTSTHVPNLWQAKIVPTSLLKGSVLPQTIKSNFYIAKDESSITPSDPRNVSDPHPEVYGGCYRSVFARGMLVVLFLHRHGDVYVTDRSAFVRNAEDVPAEDSLWVKVVKAYIEVAKVPRTYRKKKMEKMRSDLSFDINDPDSRLIAQELNRALREKHRN